jgi:hypothetical protein
MKSCQATFCTPLKICQKWARFIRKVKFCKFIENTLKTNHNGRNSILLKKKTIFAEESVEDESLLTAFFIDDQFFVINLK